MSDSKNVLVLGGSGFLGSHVADSLSEAGHSVRIFDRAESPYLRDDQTMITGDIRDGDALTEATKGCDIVYNFAGLADIDAAKEAPLETAELNVLSNCKAMEAALANNVERFVFASSVYVFSNAGSFYRASKQAAEKFVEAYAERYGLNYTILRYGSLYGRRADDRNFIHAKISEALTTQKISYSGNPKALREYIHVSDAAKLSVEILNDKFVNRHVILTGHEKMRVGDLLAMLKEILPGDITVELSEELENAHYVYTPYNFNPTVGHKLVSVDFVDIGQGLLDCISELHKNGG